MGADMVSLMCSDSLDMTLHSCPTGHGCSCCEGPPGWDTRADHCYSERCTLCTSHPPIGMETHRRHWGLDQRLCDNLRDRGWLRMSCHWCVTCWTVTGTLSPLALDIVTHMVSGSAAPQHSSIVNGAALSILHTSVGEGEHTGLICHSSTFL